MYVLVINFSRHQYTGYISHVFNALKVLNLCKCVYNGVIEEKNFIYRGWTK